MKTLFLIPALVLILSTPVLAKDTLSSEILADLSTYIGKPVTMSGLFSHSEAARESFFMDQNGVLVEVFIRNLPKINKEYILSQRQNSKTQISVAGTIQGYSNKQNAFFLNASALQESGGSFYTFRKGLPASMADILDNPSAFIGRSITMTGMFSYSEPMRESFMLNQNDHPVEIFIRDIPKAQRDQVFAIEQDSKTEITVTGNLQAYANKENAYFMNATSMKW